MRCAGDRVERAPHVGKGRSGGGTASVSGDHTSDLGVGLPGGAPPPRAQSWGRWGRGLEAPPLPPPQPGAPGSPDAAAQPLARLQGHGSQSCLNPPRARPIGRLTGGPGKTDPDRFRVGAGGRRKRGEPPLLHSPSSSPRLSAVPTLLSWRRPWPSVPPRNELLSELSGGILPVTQLLSSLCLF